MPLIPISDQAEQVFEMAMRLPEAERLAFLETTCGDDKALFHRIDSLLVSAQNADKYFDGLSVRFGLKSVLDGDAELPQRKTIGPYKLIRLIGRGGMGAVYLAERADGQFDKDVALKILPIGIGGESARQRFLTERQILARLVHPNIARLLDGGITEDSTPYFVMDYVDGITIDEFADAKQLDIPARLRLFLEVAKAIDYAHRNLIVHRDVKPGNVLVEADGAVKLVDFGIAKLLTPAEADASLTMAGWLPMTVLYSSPEAIRGEPTTTAMDTYSLGVLLYRMLTGCYPHPVSEDIVETRNEILAREAQLASRAVEASILGDVDQAEKTAICRRTTSKHLAQRLRGDIDTILDKALAQKPPGRYSSVEQFAADIRRHLQGLPIQAKPVSTLYRFGKFARRRKGLVASAVAITALIVTVASLTINFALTTQRQATVIAQERDKAVQIKDFLITTFTSAHPDNAERRDITARELLDRGAERIDAELIDNPELHAELLLILGDVYSGLQLFEPAKAQFEKALAAYERGKVGNTAQFADALQRVAEMLERLGDYDAIEKLANRAAIINERTGSSAGLADNLSIIARVRQRRGILEGVESLHQRALQLRLDAYGERHELVADSLNELGYTKRQQEDFVAAEKLYRQALQIHLDVYGGEHINIIQGYHSLGGILRKQGRLSEAEVYYEDALKVLDRVLPEGSADAALMHNGLGVIYRDQDDNAKAAASFRRASSITREFLGNEHPNMGILLANLGDALIRDGNCAEAEIVLAESSAIISSSIPDHPVAEGVRINRELCAAEARGR